MRLSKFAGVLHRLVCALLIPVLLSASAVFTPRVKAIEYTDNAKIRVGLEFGASSPSEAVFTCSQGFMVVSYDETNHTYTPIFQTAETTVTVKNVGGKAILLSKNGTPLYSGSEVMYIRGNNNSLKYKSKIYIEVIKLQCKDGLLRVINFLSLENYIKGVLPREIFPSWPEEALKTAAIVARTFAISSLSGKHKSYGCDVCTTTCCQVFGGNGDNEDARTNAAVDATRNIVVAYGSKTALTVYTSSTGGHTESSSGAWGSSQEAYPYLAGVAVPFETPEEYPNGKWTKTVSSADLKAYLNSKYGGKLTGDISKIETEHAETGYCRKITVTDTNGNVLSAKASGGVRDFLARYVHSAKFTIKPNYYEVGSTLSVLSGDGTVQKRATLPSGNVTVMRAGSETPVPLYKFPAPCSFTIEGYGYGHGVGLSQYGSMTLAKNGKTYEEIIATYFPGTYLTTLGALGMVNALEAESSAA